MFGLAVSILVPSDSWRVEGYNNVRSRLSRTECLSDEMA